MNLNAVQLAGLNRLISLNGGTLQHTGSAGTVETYSVYKSAYTDNNSTMDNTGLMLDYDNLFVMGKTSEIGSWNLAPFTSEVTLDGVKYMVGKTVTINGPATTVWLRKHR